MKAFTIGTFDRVDKMTVHLFRAMRAKQEKKDAPLIFVSDDITSFNRNGQVPMNSLERRIEMCSLFGHAVPQSRMKEVLGPYISSKEKLTFFGYKDDAEYDRIVKAIAPMLKKLSIPRRMFGKNVPGGML